MLQFRGISADNPVMEREGAQPVSVRAHIAVLGPLALAPAAMIAVPLGASPGAGFDVARTSAACGAITGTWLARRHADPSHRFRWTLWALAAAA